MRSLLQKCPAEGLRRISVLSSRILIAAVSSMTLGVGHGESDKPAAPEAKMSGLPWYSHNLHPELPDATAHILVPQSVHVPADWKQEVLSSESAGWKVSVSGNCPARKEVGITLSAGLPAWDVYSKLWVALDVVNRGEAKVMLKGTLGNSLGPEGGEVIAPGETRTLAILVPRKLRDKQSYLIKPWPKLSAFPGGHFDTWRKIDAGAVKELGLHASSIAPQISLELGNLRAVTDFGRPTKEELGGTFFPYMDRFGQNRYETWDGKITSIADLSKSAKDEDASLRKTPRVKSWDQYGGWVDGPKLEATGHFRVEKNNGAWWFVDPDGHLFWSFGVDCVISEDTEDKTVLSPHEVATPSAEEPSMKSLPGVSGGRWSPYIANLSRKYGPSWHADFISTAHRRLEAWGINTVGNWSEHSLLAAHRTPYVFAIHYARPTLRQGRTYYQADLPDVFASGFTEKLRAAVTEAAVGTADDPWCIGYFVDNEMPFKSPLELGQEMIAAPPRTETKKAFVQQLQQKYPSIADLNKKWGTSYADWDDFRKSTKLPIGEGCHEDAITFGITFMDRYYALCRTAVKDVAPKTLYLGSRANHYFKELFEVCAKYVDVISINFYQYSPVSLSLIENPAWDKPFLIGEFHFGTLTEQGVWGPGLAQAKDVAHSARLLEGFVDDCLANPQIVGAHWFQFADQPLSGRGDGENYRVGLVNIVDVPYAPLIHSTRAVGERMYDFRSKAFARPSP